MPPLPPQPLCLFAFVAESWNRVIFDVVETLHKSMIVGIVNSNFSVHTQQHPIQFCNTMPYLDKEAS